MRQQCSLEYITVDKIAQTALSLDSGALIAKADVKSAYHLVPVCPQERKWLDMADVCGWNAATWPEVGAKGIRCSCGCTAVDLDARGN
jgi:hypothetical protein